MVATIAGLSAIGVALFPTTYKANPLCQQALHIDTGFTCHPDWLHFGSAAAFFVCLAIFCFFLFPKGARKDDNSFARTPANSIYFACASLIVLSIRALALYWIVSAATKAVLEGYYYVFWFEALGVIAFAVSWLTKGKIIAGIRSLGQRNTG